MVAQIVKLEQQVADLRARLPKHSVPPAMMIALEELEEELARLREVEECA
ncbi:MAG: histidine kinase [Anaerolineae bacterium]|nr:histidine kinase [Anaerolineae bacterium]